MPVVTRQIGPCFAAEVEGIDMTRPLSADEVKAIHAGMDRYAVLVFHGQAIDDEQQLAFTRSLGEIELAVGTSLRAANEYRLPTTFADVSNLDQTSEGLRPGRPATSLRHRQPAVALRQLVQGGPGEVFAAARPRDSVEGRQHRVRLHARGLRLARGRDQGGGRGPDLRALADLLAPAARLHRLHRRGARALQAGAPAPGARASRHRTQVALPLLARRGDRRLARARGALLPARPLEHATQRESVSPTSGGSAIS